MRLYIDSRVSCIAIDKHARIVSFRATDFFLESDLGLPHSQLFAGIFGSVEPWKINSMRVLFVHFGDDWIFGSEKSLLDIMCELKRLGNIVTLWCNADSMRKAAIALDIPTYQDDFAFYFDFSSGRFSPSNYRHFVKKGGDLIHFTGADVVHCNGGAPAQWMVPAGRWRGTPVIANIRAPYLRRSRYVLGLHLVDSIVAVSTAIAQPFLDDGMDPDKVRVIYNGFAPGPLLMGDETVLKSQLGIPENAVVGVIVGSLIYRKGHDLLFKAMELLEPTGSPFHLLVVGDGPDRPEFEALASGLPIHFLGYREDIGAILRHACDFLVIPSRQEAFGRVVIEAGICGIPAVGTMIDGIPETIEDGVTGILVPPESPSAIAAAIGRMIADADLRQRMGFAARIRSERFSLENSVKSILDLYKVVTEARGKNNPPLLSLRKLMVPYYNLIKTRVNFF